MGGTVKLDQGCSSGDRGNGRHFYMCTLCSRVAYEDYYPTGNKHSTDCEGWKGPG